MGTEGAGKRKGVTGQTRQRHASGEGWESHVRHADEEEDIQREQNRNEKKYGENFSKNEELE